MIAAVVPCLNEETRIEAVITNLLSTSIDLIIVIANGCTDRSVEIVKNIKTSKVSLLVFEEPLGVDIPRAFGAKYAFDQAAEMVLFVDGDMTGDLSNNFQQLIDTAKNKNLDLALTNCYPTKGIYSSLAQRVLCYRFRLNDTLGYAADLDVASPSHGPHVLSRNFLEKVPFDYLAKPPLLLSLAKIRNLQVGIGTVIAHGLLGSKQKNNAHNLRIADTIVGDCLEAINLYQGESRSRNFRDKLYLGYDAQRRFDLLRLYLKSEI